MLASLFVLCYISTIFYHLGHFQHGKQSTCFAIYNSKDTVEGGDTRVSVTIWLAGLSVLLIVGAIVAFRSKRPLAKDVSILMISLLPPIIGNLLIILSGDWFISRIGNYLYFVGLDFTIVSLARFTARYCSIPWENTRWRLIILSILGIDVIQLLLNPIFGHAFTTTEVIVEGLPYYTLVPFLGQTFHRVVVYGVFFVSIGVFVYKTIKAPRIYVERYLVILLVMVFTGVWQSYYIFSGSPVDRSMIGFGVFGLLVFYFALYYKPMRLLDRMLARVVSDVNHAVFFFDRDEECIYANDDARKLFGLDKDADLQPCVEKLSSIVGQNLFTLEDEWKTSLEVSKSELRLDDGEGTSDKTAEQPQAAENGKRYFELEFHRVEDELQRPVGSFLWVRDRTEEEIALQNERYNAIHDPLTGLYNANHLHERSEEVIRDNPDTDFCVVGIDIREFKLINDIFSREFGDTVLCRFADDIRAHSTPSMVYGRISGDRFGFVVARDEFDPDDLEAFLNDWGVSGHISNYPVIIHAGIYEVDERDMPASVMFDRAFMAVSSIKHDHRRRMAFYDNAMREDAIWNQQISAELDEAIATNQIVPYLQPMVNEKGEVEGAEVLVRWMHPKEGFLSPARFIPFFEENGRIAQLDMHMWESACRILSQWEKAGIDLFLSVNISPKDFYFIDVHKAITDLVQKYEINPAHLRLEITETVMMSDVANRLNIIERLRSSGFMVEMDDFGSGYSSLNMLKDIPVDVLKIDMMFLYKTKDQGRAETILQMIINLTDQLGIPSITEGVETPEQLEMLLNMGCRMFQGYYFARPMPRDEFEAAYCQAA